MSEELKYKVVSHIKALLDGVGEYHTALECYEIDGKEWCDEMRRLLSEIE